MSLTGNNIRTLREQTGLTGAAFGTLLGVHQSTVYRWEKHENAAKELQIEPLQVQIMRLITDELKKRRKSGRDVLMSLLSDAVASRGTLGALHVLLTIAYGVPAEYTPPKGVVETAPE